MPRIREKPCARCAATPDALFRVQHEADADWVFLCQGCLDTVKPDNPHYRYGGTWKRRKR